MSANSKIEWTDHTFNPWIGCTKVSPACEHCYAEVSTPSRTLGVAWGPKAERRRTTPSNWNLPLRWNAQAEAFRAQHGRRQRVFCASLADVFDNEVPDAWRADLFSLIEATPNLDWLLLTKRIGNVGNMLPVPFDLDRLYPNVWIGATICNQQEADRDISKLLAVPARVRFLSMEPLLGPVDLTNVPVGGGQGHHEFDPIITGNALHRATAADPHVHWVIVGGESGPHARPMHPDWARSLRDQCQAAGVAFHFKQWGEWHPAMGDVSQLRLAICKHTGNSFQIEAGQRERHFHLLDRCQMHRVGKKLAGRLLDGRTWDEVPA